MQTTATATGLGAGIYTVTVKDAKNCVVTATVEVIQPKALVAVATSTPVACFGEKNGTATVVASEGNGGYTYSWSSSPVQTTATATGLGAGIYTVTVKDAKNCVVTATVEVIQPKALVAVASATPVACFGEKNGTATVVASEGNGGYTYSWSSSPVQTTATATGLGAGIYTVTVKDAKNCVVTATVEVIQPKALVAVATSTPVACFGEKNGTATVVASEGNGGYTYSWSSSPVQTTATATGLGAGIYTVTVKDAKNCVVTATVEVIQPKALVAVATSTPVACFGEKNGTATVVASEGNGGYTYSWSSSPVQTTATATGLGAGIYTVTVKDAKNCVVTATVEVIQPKALVAVATSTPVACFGEKNGTATVVASEGNGGYTYSWSSSPVQTTATATGLGAGIYTVTVKDAKNCVVTATVEVIQPKALVAVATSTPVACFGEKNGTATVVASEGNGGYTYSWSSSPVQTTATATGLGAGIYTVTVKDAKNCVVTATVEVIQPKALVAVATSTPVACFGEKNGTATVVASEGNGGYTYSWSSSPVQTTATATGLGAGIYTVTVKDAKNCVVTATVEVIQPKALVAVASATPVACFGEKNGTATVVASEGNGGYTYSWSSSPVQTTATATGLGAGIYTVTVKDAKNCVVTATVEVIQPKALVAVATSTPVACFGEKNGTATVVASEGNGGYTYSWSSSPVQTTATATGLGAGIYTVTVKDAKNCVVTATVEVIQPKALVAVASATPVACFGEKNGTATVVASEGNGGYTYSWSSSPVQTTATATGLGAGIYTVTVKDAKNCVVTATVEVIQPKALVAVASATPVACFGEKNGTATVVASEGNGGYTYSWSSSPVQTTATATGLGAGIYTVTVKDAKNCVVTATVEVIQPKALVAVASATPVACFGEKNGTATVVASEGNGGYTYSWSSSPVQTTATATGLGAGIYTVTVKDAKNCVVTATVEVIQPKALVAVATSTPVACFGEKNGTATVVASEGNGGYTYSWSSSPVQTTATATGLGAGIYTVTVKDAKNCVVTATVEVIQPKALVAVATSTPVACFGEKNGTATVVASEGNGGYTYSWSSSPVQTTATATGLGAGIYTVTVKDAKNCVVTATVEVIQPKALVAVATSTPVACFGEKNGTATVVASEGNGGYTYSWSSSPVQTTATATGLGAGIYTVTVKDAKNCVVTATVEVIQPKALVAVASATPVACFGEKNGTATVVASEGNGGYTYSWSSSPVQTTATATGLGAGIYTVTVKDAKNCVVTATVEVIQPKALVAVATSTPVACFGEKNGTATVVASEGNGGYTYSWSSSPVQTTATATGLGAGIYTVTVKDAKNCVVTATVEVIQPKALVAVATSTPVACFGEKNGTATVVASEGNGGYTYSWSSSPVQTTATATGLGAGIYTVTVKDAKNCVVTATVEVIQPKALVAVATSTPVACFGEKNGTATVVASEGNGGYTYSWSSSPVQTTATATGLGAGIYTVTVKDAKNCVVTATVEVIQPKALVAVATSTPVACFGEKNGTATVVASEGNGGYTYSWSSSPVQTTATATGLGAGIYTVTVKDAKNCVVTATVEVIQPKALVAVATSTPVACFGEKNGTATVVASEGNGGYTYSWSSSPVQTTATATGLGAGIYTVTVKDAKNCVVTATVEVIQPKALVAVASATPVACFGEKNGTATVVASEGNGGYTYSWSSSPVQTTATATGLGAGIYTVTVKDAKNCVVTATVEVIQPKALVAVASATPVACFGEKNGTATVVASEGNGGYTYSWSSSPVQTTATATGLGAGIYTVTVKDAKNCVVTATVEVIQPKALVAVATSTPVACFGEKNGTATVVASEGNGGYTYSWSSSPVQTTATATGLGAGIYTVTVKDAKNCVVTATVEVIQPKALVAVASATPVACFGEKNGTATVVASEGNGGYTYSWSSSPVQTTATATGLGAGIYTVTVKDAKNCVVTATVEVIQPKALVAVASATPVACFGEKNGTATVVASEGNGGYTYSWSSSPVQTTATATGLGAGIYTVTVKDAKNCVVTATVEVIQPKALVAVATSTPVACFGEKNGTATVVASEGNGGYTYSWSSSPVQTTATATGLGAGIYTVTVKDAKNCVVTATVEVIQPKALVAVASATPVACFGEKNGTATVVASEGNGGYTYSWSSSPVQTTATATGLGAGIYTVTVKDAKNCVVTATVEVIQPKALVAVASATPVACFGEKNGTATVVASEGNGGYTYSWSSSPVQTTATATGLGAGIYTVTVKDAKNCVVTATVEVIQPKALVAVATSTPVACFGEKNGTATVVASEGNGGYTYSWSSSPVQTTATATGLGAGIYTVTVKDAKNCVVTATVEVIQPKALVAVATSTPVACFGEKNGTATVVASEGNGGYTYSWSSSPVQTTATATGLGAGIYTVTVKDAKNCVVTATVEVIQPKALVAVATSTPVACFGEKNGTATVVASEGNGGYTYSWSSSPVQTTATATGLGAGIYTVTVKDAKNCVVTATVEVIQPKALVAVASATPVACFGEKNGTATVVASEGNGGYTYSWSSSPVQTTATATGLGAGIYTVTVKDAKNCVVTATVEVIQPKALVAVASATPVACFGEKNGTATVVASEGNGGYTYSWSSSPVQTTATATGLGAGIYTVTVKDAKNCVVTATVEVIQPKALVAVATCDPSSVFRREERYSNGSSE